MSELISRRQALLGLTMMAAPFVIRTPGILMPVRDRTFDVREAILRDLRKQRKAVRAIEEMRRKAGEPLSAEGFENEAIVHPIGHSPSVAEVREWREWLITNGRRGIMVSFTAAGAAHLFAMADAEKRYKAMGLL
ncbi:MAG: hypothetical protein WBX25_15085 [Rhodomicrobium sp.]